MIRKTTLASILVGITIFIGGGETPAHATWKKYGLPVSCDNSWTSWLAAGPTTLDGEIVTGRLHKRHVFRKWRHGGHVRLIPMSNGYRYAGHGFWFDGIRSDAIYHSGKHRIAQCVVPFVKPE